MPRTRRKKINVGMKMNRLVCLASIIRFLSKVKEMPGQIKTPCWVWQGHTDDNGYGQFKLNGRARWAHRISFTIFKHSIPKEREIDHRCHNTSCVNPDHLRVLRQLANAKDGERFQHDECPI